MTFDERLDFNAADARALERVENTILGRVKELVRLLDERPELNYARDEERIAQRARLMAYRAVLADISSTRRQERAS